MLPVATKVPVGLRVGTRVGAGVGEIAGVVVGANAGLGLAVRRLGDGEAGLLPQPTRAKIRANAANARPIEPRTPSTPGLALTVRLPVSSERFQDDASKDRLRRDARPPFDPPGVRLRTPNME
jgi:hypothetical protein